MRYWSGIISLGLKMKFPHLEESFLKEATVDGGEGLEYLKGWFLCLEKRW